MKKAIVLLLSATVIFSLVGCGKDASATSSSSSTASEIVEEDANGVEAVEPGDIASAEEDEQLNTDTTSEAETEIQESKEESSDEIEANTSVNYEDYFDGNTWNLTAYAEALGYEWIPDPEYDGLVMYRISHATKIYFSCYYNGHVFVFLDDGIDCWYTAAIQTTRGNFEYTITSKEQEDIEDVPYETVEKVANVFRFIASEDADITQIPGLYYQLLHCAGPAKYFSNGLIKQREFGETIETLYCDNRN